MQAATPQTQIPVVREPLVDEKVAASYLGVSAKFLEGDRTKGLHHIRFYKVGRAVRYRISDLDAWLESRAVAA